MGLNLAYFLDVSAQQHPEKVAVKLNGYALTYAELASGAHKVANLLRSMGLHPGGKVAMMIPNTPHFPLLYYGILHAGGVAVPVNCLFRRGEIQYELEDSEAEVLFAWTGFQEEAGQAFQAVETCRRLVIVSTPDDYAQPPVGEAFMPLYDAASATVDTVQTMPEDTAVILYTSGTTGTPKGAELTHFNLFFNAFYAKDYIVRIGPEDTGLVVLPLFHSFGLTCLMNTGLMAGATLTMLPSFETIKTMEVIQRDRVTFMAAVPTMFYWMLSVDHPEQYDLSSLRVAVSGGSALPAEVLTRFEERYGLRILEGYGLTETSPIASFNMPNRTNKLGSVGTPIWGCDMRIMREDGTIAAVEEVGEIVIRGHNLMKGYYKKPGATDAAIVNGWFHTGDLARMDADGYFFIVDRKKDLIIRSGMNIYPREIEEVLYAHPDVVEVCVIGIPDRARGEEVKAYVAVRNNATVTAEQLRAYCLERLARYKAPKEFELMAALPKGPTGKLLKRRLREHHLQQQEAARGPRA